MRCVCIKLAISKRHEEQQETKPQDQEYVHTQISSIDVSMQKVCDGREQSKVLILSLSRNDFSLSDFKDSCSFYQVMKLIRDNLSEEDLPKLVHQILEDHVSVPLV